MTDENPITFEALRRATSTQVELMRDRDRIELMQDRIEAQGKIDRYRIEELKLHSSQHAEYISDLETKARIDGARIAELESHLALSDVRPIELEVKFGRFTDSIRTLVNDIYVSSLARAEGLSAELATLNRCVITLNARIDDLQDRFRRLDEVKTFTALHANMRNTDARDDAQKQPQEGG